MRIRRDSVPRGDFERELMAEQPHLTPAAALCLEAWQRLDNERPPGFWAAGKIPFRAIVAWAELLELTPENTDLVAAVVEQQDNYRMDRIATEARSKS